MKSFILISVLLTLAACKGQNANKKEVNMVFDNGQYMTIEHKLDQSLLRRKLLNLVLTKKLNLKDETEVVAADTFSLKDEVHALNNGEREEYERFKSTSAELIVSYNERQEIYFLPTGINRDSAFAKLKLVPDTNQTFFWVTDETVFLKGRTYYLVSTDLNELKENDVHFFHKKFSAGEKFNETKIELLTTQSLDLELDIAYFEKQTSVVNKTGKKIRCTPDMRESGCEQCNYKIENISGTSTAEYDVKALNLFVSLNGKLKSLSEFPYEKVKNKLVVHVSLKEVDAYKTVRVEFVKNPLNQILRKVNSFDVSYGCDFKSVSETLDLTPEVKMSLDVQVNGRDFR